MFINVEGGKVKLYDLRIYKKFESVQTKLKYDSPYEYITEEDTWYSFTCRRENDLKILQSYKEIGRVEKNDFFDSGYDTLYECKYLVYHLNEIFLLLESIENCNYSKLDLLNRYIDGEVTKDNQELFEKYRKEILRSLKLVEILSLDIPNFMDAYNLVLKKSNGEIKQILERLKKHIYTMDLESIPKLVLKK